MIKKTIISVIVGALLFLGLVCWIRIVVGSPQETLAEINAAYQHMDPRDYLDLPAEQKEACLEWAFGKDCEMIPWHDRPDKMRELHPKLNPEDFAGHREMGIFWGRVTRAWLNATDEEG